MGKKESNEITVKIKGTLQDLYTILEEKHFKKIEMFSINDTYFIPQNLEMNKLATREILTKAILVRDITRKMPEMKYERTLTVKKKEIDLDGNIINQSSIDCEVLDIGIAKSFVEAIGYKSIMTIREDDIVYEKDDFELAIKNIVNGDKLIEIETNDKNPAFNTIEKLKRKLTEIDNYFVKKAEIESDKILGR